MKLKLIKYLFVGVINTIFGYTVILILMFIGIIPEISNFVGYLLGVGLSYFLNKKFTFKSNIDNKQGIIKFYLSMLIAYILNLFVLIVTYRIFNINPYISQIFAGIVYTLIGFLLSNFFVFVSTRKFVS